LIIDELSFILYNISLYQIFCGSNYIKIYESFFKLPIANVNHINLVLYSTDLFQKEYIELFEIKKNINVEDLIVNDYTFYKFSLAENLKLNTLSIEKVINSKVNNIFLVHFDTLTTQKNKITFEILQNKIYICPGESTLAFFRICNNTNEAIQAFSIYIVSPTEFTPFINKLQCFCYEELLLYPNETIDLPVLFRLENDIKRLDNIAKEIVIEYIIVF